MPRGNEPVLFSRSANSSELIAASTVSLSIPSSASRVSVAITSASTLSASAASIPLRPTVKYGCSISSATPLPVRPSPSPLSISALRSGDAAVPTRMNSSTLRLSARFGSSTLSSIQLIDTIEVFLPASASFAA